MRRTLIGGITLVLLAWLVPSNAGAKCFYNGYDKIACTPYVDGNVIVLGSAYNPTELTVELGARVLFQNFDAATHTVTVENATCRATSLGTSCHQWFDITLPPNARLQTARPVFTSYLMPGDYAYYCKIHSPSPGEGMTAILHIVAL